MCILYVSKSLCARGVNLLRPLFGRRSPLNAQYLNVVATADLVAPMVGLQHLGRSAIDHLIVGRVDVLRNVLAIQALVGVGALNGCRRCRGRRLGAGRRRSGGCLVIVDGQNFDGTHLEQRHTERCVAGGNRFVGDVLMAVDDLSGSNYMCIIVIIRQVDGRQTVLFVLLR